jgi:hypothetical protein
MKSSSKSSFPSEDYQSMKKYCFLVLTTVLTSTLLVGAAMAQQPSEEDALYGKYYEVAKQKPVDMAKLCPLAKEYVEKHPSGTYAQYVGKTHLQCLYEVFNTALKDFYAGQPDMDKLVKLEAAGNDVLKKQPEAPFVIAQVALAYNRATITTVNKDLERAKMQAEKSLQVFESATPAKDWKPEDWSGLRENIMAQSNQVLGFIAVQKEPADVEGAVNYLSKAVTVKEKNGLGWKDPNNYWLRAGAYSKQYDAMSKEYNDMPTDVKTSDAGKATLAKLDPVVEKLIDDYARVVSLTAGNAGAQQIHDAAKDQLEQYWKYYYGGKTDGMMDYVGGFKADPTTGPSRPPKPVQATTPASTTPGTGKPGKPGKPAPNGNR